MSSKQGGWFPREGFTADLINSVVKNTILNPTLTLPLYLLARYTRQGQELSLEHAVALRRLKICLYLGLARYVNNFLNWRTLNNWTSDKWNWEKELVVITGGSDGFGKLVVQKLATKNVKIVILDIQPPTYELPNTNIHYHALDLASPTAISTVSQEIISTHGNPTILVQNAGLTNCQTILGTPDAALERLFAINTLSHYRLTRAFLPAMISANHGLVLTVASLAAFVTVPGLVDYCASKAAALAFHEGLAAELKDRYDAPRVRTVCVCPHFAETKLTRGFANPSRFASPTLKAETVAQAMYDAIVRGDSGVVPVPGMAWWMAMSVRSWPFWAQVGVRADMRDVMRGVEKARKEDEEVKARSRVGAKEERAES